MDTEYKAERLKYICHKRRKRHKTKGMIGCNLILNPWSGWLYFWRMKIILYLVMVLIKALFLLALGVAVVLGFGALLAQLVPLSLYQASLLTVFTAFVLMFIAFVMTFITRFRPGLPADLDDDDWEDEEEEEEDEEEEDEEDGWGGDDGRPMILHAPLRNTEPKPGRNSPCPCGSGRKYKNCCGGVTAKAGSDAGTLPF